MSLSELVIFTVALVFGILGTIWAIRKFDLRRENFRQERIPAVAGLVLVIAGVFFYTVEWMSQGIHVATAATYFLVTFAFGTLGMLDDVNGDRSVGGFRGHIGAVQPKGRLTTGLGKMIGGAGVSLVAGFLPVQSGSSGARRSLAAILIALTANTLNLLDLRPGRSLFGFFLGAIAVVSTLGSFSASTERRLPLLLRRRHRRHPLSARCPGRRHARRHRIELLWRHTRGRDGPVLQLARSACTGRRYGDLSWKFGASGTRGRRRSRISVLKAIDSKIGVR